MKGPLPIRQAVRLYTCLLGLAFLFYGLGISLGRNHLLVAPGTEPPPSEVRTPVEDVTSGLNFYEQLSHPVEPPAGPPEVDRATRDVEPPAGSDQSSRRHTVQVGAFTGKGDMRRMLLRLKAKGYPSIVSEASGADPYFRVWVGEFLTRRKAREMEASLREDGFPTFVRTLPSAP